MNPHDPTPHISSECVDVVMKELPELFHSLGFPGNEVFVYSVTYYSVREEQGAGRRRRKSGAAAVADPPPNRRDQSPPTRPRVLRFAFRSCCRRRARRSRAVRAALMPARHAWARVSGRSPTESCQDECLSVCGVKLADLGTLGGFSASPRLTDDDSFV